MGIIKKNVVFCLVLLLAGCISAGNIKESISAEFITCLEAAELKTGEFIVSNNVWNKSGVVDYAQCIFQIHKNTIFPLGWKWEWPEGQGLKVKAYPEIIYGWKPWSGQSTTVSLPLKISAMKEMVASFDVEMQAEGRYNLAFDIWLNRSSPPGGNNISRELMIWLDSSGIMNGGSFVEDVMIDGEKYELYIGSVSHASWTYIAFIKLTPQIKGQIKIHEFINYLVNKNHISAQEYVSSIEFGNELVSGSGQTVINDYKVAVR